MNEKEYQAARGAEFYKRYYSQLAGATIISFEGFVGESDEDEGFPQFKVRLTTGKVVDIEVSRDPEGNGGGFLFGLNMPSMTDWVLKSLEEAK